MSKPGFLDKLIAENRLAEFLQMVQDGESQQSIADFFGVAQPMVCRALKKIKEQQNTEEQPISPAKTPYEILYENRKEVVRLKREGKYNVEIAQIMGVSDKDVFDFFEKRVKLTPKQVKEIKLAVDEGKSLESIAQIYGTSTETIKGICKSTIVSTQETTEVQDETIADLDCIAKFWQFLHQVETKSTISAADESKIDKEIQDLLHKIEMEDCTEEESLRIIERIKELRQERRTCKDYLSLVAPILEFLKDDTNAKCLKTLANIAGRVNNKAKQMQNRIYFMRTREKDDE